ncbi:hypothetical protein ZBT109_2379 [Zymobacter palmae]|uniref:Uncharacterized protein n=1 Tax=Zymobacter palmae TaxID=33074 RepID=A0A348HHK8_9GAMM|nr:hypothetical protein ZBT109_2379 [Zymobacter palmae]
MFTPEKAALGGLRSFLNSWALRLSAHRIMRQGTFDDT